MKSLSTIASALSLLIVASEGGHAQDMSLALARQTNGRPPSLNLVCGASGNKHLVLVARLPFPRSLERNIRPGRRESATLFVNGTARGLDIAFELTSVGKRASTLRNYLGFTEDGGPDTAYSGPLKPAQIDALVDWFGAEPPKKVSVSGLVETSVVLRSHVTGSAIRAFAASCPS